MTILVFGVTFFPATDLGGDFFVKASSLLVDSSEDEFSSETSEVDESLVVKLSEEVLSS